MKKLLIAGLALGLALGTAQAEHHAKQSCPGPGCEAPPPKMRVIYVEQEVTDYRWVQKERMTVLKSPVIVTAPVPAVPREVQMPVFAKEIRKRTVLVPVPRRVVREVEECHMVPECKIDPITGEKTTCSKPVTAVRTEVVTVYQLEPREEEYMVDVVVMSPEDDLPKDGMEEGRIKIEIKKPEAEKELYLERVPYKKKIKVPVLVPCDAPAAAPEKLPEPKPPEKGPEKTGR
jgi:hypothetical protein